MTTGSPRQLWLLPVLLITVIATALGGLFARNLYTEVPSLPPAAAPSSSAVPLSEQPGSPTVQGTADAVGHPLYGQLQPLLQRHFDAINAKDFEAWAGTVSASIARNRTEAEWRDAYSTTRDGSILIHRIEARGDGTARVLLRLTSTQAAEDGPWDLTEPCVQWRVVYPFAVERGEWRQAPGYTSRSARVQPCPDEPTAVTATPR